MHKSLQYVHASLSLSQYKTIDFYIVIRYTALTLLLMGYSFIRVTGSITPC